MTNEEYKELPIKSRNKIIGYLKIDNDDFKSLSKRSININKYGYPVTTINGKSIRIHRFVMKAKSGEVVDHIFHDKFDARKSQLRIVDQLVNNGNRKISKTNKSGFRGVCKTRNGKSYRSYVFHKGKEIYCGTFDTAEEAGLASSSKRAELNYLDAGHIPKSSSNINRNQRKLPLGGLKYIVPIKSTKCSMQVCIRHNKKRIFVGQFQDLQKAIEARNNKLKELNPNHYLLKSELKDFDNRPNI